MKFEWDPAKNRANVAKHGVAFEDAKGIFKGPTLDVVDARFDYGEERIISVGLVAGIVLIAVVHTDRDGTCRMISARQANRKERARYDEAIRKTTDG